MGRQRQPAFGWREHLPHDSANRLTSVLGPQSSVQYSYNGLGDRLTQNDVHYTLDLNAGLTQALDDGDNTYLYGNGRIAQTGGTTEYFLGDALGSVRQLTSKDAEITLTKSYAPYGEVRSTSGSGESAFAFTGEQVDVNSLVYLRARFYAPTDGRFLTRDTWDGDEYQPITYNKWTYANVNPIYYTDPSGKSPGVPPSWREEFVERTVSLFNISYIESWSLNAKFTIADAVFDVGYKFSSTYPRTWPTPWVAFRSVYKNGVNFSFGTSCYGCRPPSCINEGLFSGTSSAGEFCTPAFGVTYSTSQIEFASFYENDYLKGRNNVVHELGHAFDNLLDKIPSRVLGQTETWIFAGSECAFPHRTNEEYGPYYGFASPKGFFTWQMNPAADYSEEFADTFLGWVYNKWETDQIGNLTKAGQIRVVQSVDGRLVEHNNNRHTRISL